jgi:hypothetical protein
MAQAELDGEALFWQLSERRKGANLDSSMRLLDGLDCSQDAQNTGKTHNSNGALCWITLAKQRLKPGRATHSCNKRCAR